MKREFVFVVSGTLFGLIVGWILGSQASGPAPPAAPQVAAAPAPGDPMTSPPPIDTQLAASLEQQVAAEPANVTARIQLANLYFDGERFAQAVPYYEQALALDPQNTNVSTDLAVCYYYIGQTERALTQLDQSLAIEPNHVKTLFNQGVIRAGGMADLPGAVASFERVVALAPDSQEGLQAREILQTIADANHTATGGGGAGAGAGG